MSRNLSMLKFSLPVFLSIAVSACGGGSSSITSAPSQQYLTVSDEQQELMVTSASTGNLANLHAMAKGNGVYVAVGESGNVEYSSDGQYWSSITIGNGIDLHGVTFNSYNNLFYAVGDNSSVYSSTDGKNWIVYKSLNPTRDLYSVMSVDGNLVIGAESSTIFEIAVKQRGLVTERSTVDNMKLLSATYGNGVMLLGSDDGSLLYKLSSNWATGTWNRATKFPNTAINGLSFESVDSWYMAATSTGSVTSSANGITWSTPVMAEYNGLNSITLEPRSNSFIAVGGAESAAIVSSPDFNTWGSYSNLPVTGRLNAINCFDQDDCFIVGNNGVILYGAELDEYSNPVWIRVDSGSLNYQTLMTSGSSNNNRVASFTTGYSIVSKTLFSNNHLQLVLTSSGNLVCSTAGLGVNPVQLWSSNTGYGFQTSTTVAMQSTGNLVVNNESSTYSSNTNESGAYLVYDSAKDSINIVAQDGRVLKVLCAS